MKLKHGIIILILGYCLTFIGSLLKIQHWANGDNIFIIATILEVAGLLIILYKILNNPKLKDILNS